MVPKSSQGFDPNAGEQLRPVQACNTRHDPFGPRGRSEWPPDDGLGRVREWLALFELESDELDEE